MVWRQREGAHADAPRQLRPNRSASTSTSHYVNEARQIEVLEVRVTFRTWLQKICPPHQSGPLRQVRSTRCSCSGPTRALRLSSKGRDEQTRM